MSINRKQELQRIVDESFLPNTNQKNIFFIEGLFGVGKSWLINAIIEIFAENKLCDAFLKFDNSREVSFLPDYMMKCIGNTIDKNGDYREFSINEISFQNDEFYNLLNKIKHNKTDDFEKIVENYFISNSTYINLKFQSKDKKQKLSIIEDLLTRNMEKRLLFNTSRVFAEALIVDTINNLFPIDKNHQSLQSYLDEGIRKKVLLTFDNFDSLSCCILEFLMNDLFPLAFNMKFSDFITQKFILLSEETKVSDLIDFRIIVALRKKVLNNYPFEDYENFKDNISEIELQPFSRDDIETLLNDFGYDNSQLESILKISYGLAYILELWFETKKYQESEDNEKIFYKLISERINKYFSEEESEWLLIASYLEKFNENLLRCFPQMHTKYKEVWEFFRINNDLCENYKDDREYLTIKSLIRHYIHQYEPEDKAEKIKEINKIEYIFNSAEKILKNLNTKHRTILLNLSYFKRFDFSNSLKQFTSNDIKQISQFIESHQEFFIKNQFTYSVIEEYRTKLINFNKYWDQEKYEEKKELAEKAWELAQKEIITKKNRLEKELDNLELEEKDLIKSQSDKKQLIDKLQKQILQNENEIIIIKRRINLAAGRINLRKAGFCFVIGLFVIFTSIFTDSILRTSLSQEALSTLKTFLQIVSILFGFCGIIYSLKYLFNKSRKREIERQKQKINSIEKEIEKLQSEAKQINEEVTIAQNRSDYLKEKNSQILSEISLLNAQLRENYV